MANLILSVNSVWMHDPELDLLDKLLLSYIANWESRGNVCFAKDDFFENLLGVTRDEVSFSLIKLEERGKIQQIRGIGGRVLKVVTQAPKKPVCAEIDIFEI